MAKKSKIVKKIKLVSTASPYFYTTTKSPKMSQKLSKRKFDPIVGKHVVFTEARI